MDKEVYSSETCLDCGVTFDITKGEKDFYLVDLPQKRPEITNPQLPKRCPACRKARKNK
jgi:hypothetical protein